MIFANTFAAARHMLEPGGLGERVREINVNVVRLAQQARDNASTDPVAVAGSICEWAPQGDEKWATAAAIGDSVREQAEILAESGVDLLAFEMCEQVDMSAAAVEAAMETGLPIWIGMSARTHAGCASLSVFDDADLDFESLVRRLACYPATMMTIMHTPISDIAEALAITQRHWQGPVGIYPESGYFAMPNWQFVDIIEPDQLVEEARQWVADGVRMVGGCCGLGPAHIAALRHAFKP